MLWIGADPGGKENFGIATLSASGEVRSSCVSCADEAVAWISQEPSGVGVDAPLWWSSGLSSERRADQWIRQTYKIPGGTVQSANSLRGAALVQAVMFISRLREKFPDAPVTEAHPKAVAMALGGWDRVVATFPEVAHNNEHQRDAIFAAIAAREGFQGRWKRDLALDRRPSEQDPRRYWLAPINYFWPEERAS
ncbi:MAG TPA: DUF429 domain-containing protein [Rhizomicrobium sp.]|nr:DUF429 domain-containing protein [Rhizomicrobium sp.]